MDDEVEIECEEQFWDEIDDVVTTPCRTHDRIDDTLRTWLGLSTRYKDEYLQSEHELARCSLQLHKSPLFAQHEEYVRRQLVYVLLQEDDPTTLHLVAKFLLADGRESEDTFKLMKDVGCFPRLVEHVTGDVDDGRGLHRINLELIYEMSRIQRLSLEDLAAVGDSFVLYLLDIIEELSNDVNDPYHYPTIRVLLVLNEQYMIAAHDPSTAAAVRSSITNRVVKSLSVHGRSHKSFGENLILLLNRETETSLQLLILKLLYLLFSTSATQEYFYTNDLHVLVDIVIRNVLDLPASEPSSPTSPDRPATSTVSATASLRHTYLRVLQPLLADTQLRHAPHYKADQLRRTLLLLAHDGDSHFDGPDATTLRLVQRCLAVEWVRNASSFSSVDLDGTATDSEPTASPIISVEQRTSSPDPDDSPRKASTTGAGNVAVAQKLLGIGISLPEGQASSSSLSESIAELAIKREKPGIQTPSRARRRKVPPPDGWVTATEHEKLADGKDGSEHNVGEANLAEETSGPEQKGGLQSLSVETVPPDPAKSPFETSETETEDE